MSKAVYEFHSGRYFPPDSPDSPKAREKAHRASLRRMKKLKRRDLQTRRAELAQRQRQYIISPPANPVARRALEVELEMEASNILADEMALTA
jgi:hypothetical protein